MKLSKDLLDKKIRDFEDNVDHDLTFREWIIECENFYELEHKDLDSMNDEELERHDDFLLDLMDK